MDKRSSGEIRSVRRALTLLRFLNQRETWDLHSLHECAELPKPTVYRLLHTLRRAGYVQSDRGTGEYRLAERVQELSAGYTEKCLLVESFDSAYLDSKPVRYVEETDELIWWSERSGWAHFYLYGRDGTLKNAITSGSWRASRIVPEGAARSRPRWQDGRRALHGRPKRARTAAVRGKEFPSERRTR